MTLLKVSVPVVSIIVTSLVSASEEVRDGMESETVTLWFYQIPTNARMLDFLGGEPQSCPSLKWCVDCGT